VAVVQPDGSVVVTENITYVFIGSFEGGYREIPQKDGMSVDEISVSEGGKEYAPGASAELGSSGAPGTYGTADLDAYRIVWHYRASYEERTFTLRYRMKGLAVAHDDVVDVYERRVLSVAERVLSHGPVNLTDFEETMKRIYDRQANRSSYESFRDAVKREVERRDLIERSPGRWLGPAALVLGLARAAWFVLSLFGVNVGALISLVLSSFIGFVGAGLVVWVVFRRVLGNADSALHRMWVRPRRRVPCSMPAGKPSAASSRTSAPWRSLRRPRSPCGSSS
jgi:hypothetical protein